jgi:hypothetical protein
MHSVNRSKGKVWKILCVFVCQAGDWHLIVVVSPLPVASVQRQRQLPIDSLPACMAACLNGESPPTSPAFYGVLGCWQNVRDSYFRHCWLFEVLYDSRTRKREGKILMTPFTLETPSSKDWQMVQVNDNQNLPPPEQLWPLPTGHLVHVDLPTYRRCTLHY